MKNLNKSEERLIKLKLQPDVQLNIHCTASTSNERKKLNTNSMSCGSTEHELRKRNMHGEIVVIARYNQPKITSPTEISCLD